MRCCQPAVEDPVRGNRADARESRVARETGRAAGDFRAHRWEIWRAGGPAADDQRAEPAARAEARGAAVPAVVRSVVVRGVAGAVYGLLGGAQNRGADVNGDRNNRKHGSTPIPCKINSFTCSNFS